MSARKNRFGGLSSRCLLTCAFASSFSRLARAAEGEVAFEISTVPGCPNPREIVSDVVARDARIKEARGASRVVVIELASEGTTFQGSLAISENGVRGAPRLVHGSRCDEVARAISLIASIAVTSEPEVSPTPSSPPSAPPIVSQPTPTDPTAPTASSVTPAPRPSSSISPPKAEEPRPERSQIFSLGAALDVRSLSAPSLVVLPRLFFDVALSRDPRALDLRFSLATSVPSAVTTDVTRTTFVWGVGRVDACAFGKSLLERRNFVVLRPCFALEGGFLHAKGESRANVSGASQVRPWLAPSALLRLGWSPSRRVSFELEPSLVVPVFRQEFQYDGGSTVYRAPAVVFSVSLGAALHF